MSLVLAFDILRVVTAVASILGIAAVPATLRRSMLWDQILRFVSSAVLSVGLVAAFLGNLGTVPEVPWRTALVAFGAIGLAVGTIAYLRRTPPVVSTTAPERLVDRLANVPAAFLVADQNGQIITASGMTMEITGWSCASLVGRPLATIVPPRYVDAHFAGMDRVSTGGASHIIGKTMDLAVMTRDHNERPCHLTVLELPRLTVDDPAWYVGVVISDHPA